MLTLNLARGNLVTRGRGLERYINEPSVTRRYCPMLDAACVLPWVDFRPMLFSELFLALFTMFTAFLFHSSSTRVRLHTPELQQHCCVVTND